jgi:transposase
VQRDAKEVMAEVLRKLTGRAALDAGVVSGNGKKDGRGNTYGPNRDRLTVGVDLGDRWSQYCILGLEGETLAEGQLRTTQEDVGEYGHTTLLRQVKGVGPITSLAYVLTLEDPQRFASSRQVGPYLGLVPKQEDSGDSQPQLGISKAGDRMLRRLLVGSSQYMLGAFGPDSDLRRYGLRLCERGGKNAKKRAVVAVARKLAVLLHHL